MAEGKNVQALPVYKRVGLLLFLAVVMVVGATVGWLIARALSLTPDQMPADEEAPALEAMTGFFVLLVLGVVGLAAGFAAYFIVLATHCFTFNFNQPVLRSLKARLFVANIIVTFLLLGGPAGILGAPLMLLLVKAGLPFGTALIGGVLGLFFLLQFLVVWLQIWAPLTKSIINRRLAAYGATPEQLASAVLVGIADPARSSLKKLGMIVDDVGALWITPEALAYRGDSDYFDITPAQFIALERKADAWHTAALAGAVHVLVRFRKPDGCERIVRFYSADGWTLRAKARALDRLAEQIARWEESYVVRPVEAQPVEGSDRNGADADRLAHPL